LQNAYKLKHLIAKGMHGLTTTTEQNCTKILPQTYLWSRKSWLDFGSHWPPDTDAGIYWRILQLCHI